MICSYCQQEQEAKRERCFFCEAPLHEERPSLNRTVNQEDFSQAYPVLVTYHTYHLLLLLQQARKARTDAYNLMRITRKALRASQSDEKLQDGIKVAEDDYRQITARMNVLEGILIDRVGYKPKRIDEKMLASFLAKINHD